jgi:hypothetical protein
MWTSVPNTRSKYLLSGTCPLVEDEQLSRKAFESKPKARSPPASSDSIQRRGRTLAAQKRKSDGGSMRSTKPGVLIHPILSFPKIGWNQDKNNDRKIRIQPQQLFKS